MASDYNSDDTFNVIEQHIVQAIQADTKLGTGGDLAIATFEQEHRDDLSTYGDNQLPACSVEVVVQSLEEIAIGDHVEYGYLAHLLIITGGGKTLQLMRADIKYYAARVIRVLQQQHYPEKQLVGLPDDLAGAEIGEVMVTVSSTVVDAGATEQNPNALRGLAEIFAVVTVGYTIPED